MLTMPRNTALEVRSYRSPSVPSLVALTVIALTSTDTNQFSSNFNQLLQPSNNRLCSSRSFNRREEEEDSSRCTRLKTNTKKLTQIQTARLEETVCMPHRHVKIRLSRARALLLTTPTEATDSQRMFSRSTLNTLTKHTNNSRSNSDRHISTIKLSNNNSSYSTANSSSKKRILPSKGNSV